MSGSQGSTGTSGTTGALGTTESTRSTDTTDFSSPNKSSASPTLTDAPSHMSNARSDPNPIHGGTDQTQTKSQDPSSKLPPPQTSAQGSAATRGDAPETNTGSASDQRQVSKGDAPGRMDDTSSRLSGTQQGGPVSMSGTQTSHPGSQGAPTAGAPLGDPSSGQAPKMDKQGAEDPLKEPPKSKEDHEDEGTGQKYVKTSGVAAKGGDFDASKPGAGVFLYADHD